MSRADREPIMSHKVPTLTSNEAAEAFLGKDLSVLDYTQFRPLSLKTAKKTARIDMRQPEGPMAGAKAKMAARDSD